VDTKTRHSLKQDSFAQATASSMSWLSGHRSGVVRWVIIAVVVVVAGVVSLGYWNWDSNRADAALGTALDVYNAPLAMPGAPPASGIYATAGDR
jgi:hypothetical protein